MNNATDYLLRSIKHYYDYIFAFKTEFSLISECTILIFWTKCEQSVFKHYFCVPNIDSEHIHAAIDELEIAVEQYHAKIRNNTKNKA